MNAAHRTGTEVASPLEWYTLIHDAEAFRNGYGYGLVNVWSAIHRRDYAAARRVMDRLLADARSGIVPQLTSLKRGPHCPRCGCSHASTTELAANLAEVNA